MKTRCGSRRQARENRGREIDRPVPEPRNFDASSIQQRHQFFLSRLPEDTGRRRRFLPQFVVRPCTLFSAERQRRRWPVVTARAFPDVGRSSLR